MPLTPCRRFRSVWQFFKASMFGFIAKFVHMIGFIVKKFVGSKNEREVRRLRPLVTRINAIEEELQKLSDDSLRQKTAAWKDELSKIEDSTELARRLEEILPEAFAREKCLSPAFGVRAGCAGTPDEMGHGTF